MNNFWNSSSPSAPSKLAYAVLALALIGLADATYLTITHYAGEAVSCSVLHGCEQVLTSKYATVQGVPIAAGGMAYYAALFLLVYYYLLGRSRLAWRLFQVTIASGVAVTSILLYLQLAVIRAICQYCMLSAILTTIIAILAIAISFKSARNKPDNEIDNRNKIA